MSNVDGNASVNERLSRELYFLIIKFLSEGPCRHAAEVLKHEVETLQLLPKGINWLGQETPRNFADTSASNSHISGDFLQKICQRLLPLLEQAIPPSVKGVSSLLGTGRQSLLRPPQDPGQLLTSNRLAVCRHGAPIAPGFKTKNTFNLTNVVNARQASGTFCKRSFLQHGIFSKMSMHRRILGHLSAVYCVLFDQTGQSIVTGADDNLVKIWSSSDGRLLATLRGHSAEISDIAVNCENTLLAAGSCDKTIRVWDIQTTEPVGVLQGHTGSITSLQFCPSCTGDFRYLMSTGGDAMVTFWKYSLSTKEFVYNEDSPLKFQEKSRPGAQIICSSFSPGGNFLVTGNTDHNIRIYQLSAEKIERIAELTAHLDHVDSIQFSHSSERFLSGSKDGTARIWFYQRSEWKSLVLNSQQQLPGSSPPREEDANKITKIRVTMVGWDLPDQYVITAVNDHSVKVWESKTGKLIYVLKGHQDEIFIIEAHPTNPQLLLTAGHDGYIILWNLTAGKIVKKFYNSLEGQGHGAVFDCKFSPDGQRFATTDSHGHLAIYGFGSSEPYQKVPEEQFFHSDYRPVMRDMNNHVIDEQTQTAPHLMPPPFLVDVDGNPHPVYYQRLIPGHSSNIRPRRRVVSSPPPVPTSPMPPLLAQIEQFERAGAFPDPEELHSPPPGNNAPSLGSPGVGSRNRGLLQDGDIEGVRQLNVNIPIIQDVSESDIHVWRNRTIVPKPKGSEAKWDEERRLLLGRQELLRYLREKKKRPLPSTSRSVSQTDKKADRFLRSRARPNNRRDRPRANESRPRANESRPRTNEPRPRTNEPRPVYNTRATANTGSDIEESGDEDIIFTPTDSDDDDLPWNSSSSETSEYSDWTEEVGMNTRQQSENQRPSRRVRRVLSSSEEEGEPSTQQARPPKKDNDRSKKPPKKKKKKVPRKPRLDEIDEWLEYYRPPDWMSSTKLRRFPYVPQVGDEVYYFKQGHEMYVKEVMNQEAYEINPKKQCFSKLDLKAEELCKVVSLHYVVGPPTLASLKLAILNPETGANTGGTFTVKYHDMADVLDFFVLKQVYDQSLQREWRPGCRFRSVIDDYWWSGVVTEISPYQDNFPDSHFQCYVVSWDTGEVERMSPWDLEPIPDDGTQLENSDANTSDVDSNNIPITEEEHNALVKYIPQENEWPDEDYDTAVARLTRGLSILSELPFAGPFAYPVDVRSYPDYWSVVAYPIDLKAIIDRLANNYYRRKTALLWDVCQTGRNAKTYNEEDSEIVQNADKLVSIVSRFIKDVSCVDPLILCEDVSMENADVDVEIVEESDGEGQTAEGTSVGGKRKNESLAGPMRKKARMEEEAVDEYSLKEEILALLNMLATRSDAEPFREPVDLVEFPDYTDHVDEPIAFSTLRSRIDCDYYHEPEQFIQDVRLVFSNSRKYNTNPKSRIYSMTLRLSALFENKQQELLVNFYRHRSGSGRHTRQRSRRAVQDEPGTSGLSSPARRVVPRSRPELAPRVSARISTRRREDEGEPGTSGNDGLRMKISLTRRSVVSTTGLEDSNEGSSRSLGTSSQANYVDEGQRTRTRSGLRTSYRESIGSSSSMVSETAPDTSKPTQNGTTSRYSTRSRVPPTRLKLNGVTADHESEDDDDDEDEEEEMSGESGESSEESDALQRRKNLRSSRSGKTPVDPKNTSEKSARGKQVVKRPVRTRASSSRYDSASESDDDHSPTQLLDVSSRGRVRRKAFKMIDYVN